MTSQVVVSTAAATLFVAILVAALAAAYQTGFLDPLIEKTGVFLFKAKAKAEQQKLQAEGLKEGTDFVTGKSERPSTGVE
jgi:maltose-binding protein MalE